jgi:hypothetical protein
VKKFTILCERYLQEVKNILLPQVYISDVFDSSDPYTEEIIIEQLGL